MKPTPPPRKTRRGYVQSGFHRTKAALSNRGISALDGRSALARAVRDWRAAVASDLGGEEGLSQAQRTVLDVAAQDVVLLTVADSWLRENAEAVINRRYRRFVPLVEQRLKVASHLTGLLEKLGLERRAREIPRLSDYLAGRDATRKGPASAAVAVASPSPGPDPEAA
ncbi:MAG: hypothetical protein HY317_03195 [Acidobacteria bacterium]|nr:hypothetical protein [Acidobacteriota bacterium]